VAVDFGVLARWQACSQVRQSFCMPGHTKHCATSFAVALVPGVTDRGRTGTLGVVMELECTAEVFRQTCRSRWRRWCSGFVASLAIGRCSP
jgi:hypothetical protein